MKSKCSFILKASISLILALLMLFGTVATSFAAVDDDLAETGGGGNKTGDWYLKNNVGGSWDDGGIKVTNGGDDYQWGPFYFTRSDGNLNWRFWSTSDNNSLGARSNNADVTLGTNAGNNGVWGGSNSWQYALSNLATSGSNFYSVYIHLDPDGGDTGNSGNTYYAGWTWVTSTQLSAINPSITTKNGSTTTTSFTQGDTVSLSASKSASVGTVTYSYEYKLSTASSYTSISGTSLSTTSLTPGTYTIRVTATDGGVVNGTNARQARTETATKNIIISAPACTPQLQTSAGADLGTTKSIYKNQTLVFKTSDPSSHTATYTVYKDGSTTNTASTYLNKYSALANNTEVTFTGSATGTYVVTSTCSGGGSDSVTITVTDPGNIYFKHSTTASDVNTGTTPTTSGVTKGQITMTYDATASAALSGGKASHVVYKASITNWAGSSHYWVIYDSSRSANRVYTTAITSNASRLSGTGVSTTAWSSGQSGNVNLSSIGVGTTVVYYDVVDGKFYADLPIKVTYQGYCTSQSKNVGTAATEVKAYGATATSGKTITATGYTQVTPVKWYTTNAMSTEYTFPALTGNITAVTIYTPMTANTYTVTLDANTNGGKIKKTSGSSEANTATFTHTYGVASTIADQYNSVTPPTGYTLDGWYDAATGGTKYTSVGATAITAAKTYYAHYTEIKAGATVKVSTNGSTSNTAGGTVKIGTNGTAGTSVTISNNSFGIDTASSAIIKASTANGYNFNGWQFNSTHLKYSFDGTTYTAVASTSTTYGTSSNTTVYVKTDGTSGLTTANTEIRAMFESTHYTITTENKYYNNSATAQTGTTGGSLSVTDQNGGTYDYNDTITVTATAASGYAVERIEMSLNDGSTWSTVTTSPTAAAATMATTTMTNNTFVLQNTSSTTYKFRATFRKQYYLTAYSSWVPFGNDFSKIAAPPTKVVVKNGTTTVATYTYAHSSTTQGEDRAIITSTGTFNEGNKLQILAGYTVELYYSSLGSSEAIRGIFFNNGIRYTTENQDHNIYENGTNVGAGNGHDDDWKYTYEASTTLFADENLYSASELVQNTSGTYYNQPIPTAITACKSGYKATIDQDTHVVTFTAAQNYRNIDIELGSKYRVFFKDDEKDSVVIQSKNLDDYYSLGEAMSGSTEADYFYIKAAGNADQVNYIDTSSIKVYPADAHGNKTSTTAITPFTFTYSTGSTAISNSGAADSTAYIKITGTMPNQNVLIEINPTVKYKMYLDSKIVADGVENKTKFRQVANVTATINNAAFQSQSQSSTAGNAVGPNEVAAGTTIKYTYAFTGSWGSYYTFNGWYTGDSTGPDYAGGYITDKQTLNYTPRKNVYIYAVGTRDLYINGSQYITGATSDWNKSGDTPQNFKMSFDPTLGTVGKYYWTITEDMYSRVSSTGFTKSTKASGDYRYWNNDNELGNAWFQFMDEATGWNRDSVWYKGGTAADSARMYNVYSAESGKVSYERVRKNGDWTDQLGAIWFNESGCAGYSAPLTIYYDPAGHAGNFTVEASYVYPNIYLSHGYGVGSTTRLATATGTYQSELKWMNGTTESNSNISLTGSGWTPNHEGHVNHYKVTKKDATVRVKKTTNANDKVTAFFVYDLYDNKVYAIRDVTKSTNTNTYYADIKMQTGHDLYICPIIEAGGSNMTVYFDATQLNSNRWGKIVSCYAWYGSGNAQGDFPGQPMIPSDDGTSWSATFPSTKNSSELTGITFTNYIDSENNHGHSWLSEPGILPTVTSDSAGTIDASSSVIKFKYNDIGTADDGNTQYRKLNCKVQTYDYREPISYFKNNQQVDHAENLTLTFAIKMGNSDSVMSLTHSELKKGSRNGSTASANIFDGITHTHSNGTKTSIHKFTAKNFQYLTNAKGDQYTDLNGVPLGADNKPSATYYVIAKGEVVYKNGNLEQVFWSGNRNESRTSLSAGYGNDGDGYAVNSVPTGAGAVNETYTGVSMDYGVQWYVYDASGNYITNILSAGYADYENLTAGSVDTNSVIGSRLKELGYAVDGKSVAICYDKPRSMTTDNETGGTKYINSGTDFNSFRATGQWYKNEQYQTATVSVGVAMMTDSGEVLAATNDGGYGNAWARYDTTKGAANLQQFATPSPLGQPYAAVTAAQKDAVNTPIRLDASHDNFIGWYYYDPGTNEFTKASYTSPDDFRPNYSKDIKYYAVYRAAAIYKYKYQGREGDDYYTISGGDLTETELTDNLVRTTETIRQPGGRYAVGTLAPGSNEVSVFKTTLNFSAQTSYNNTTPYFLNIGTVTGTTSSYTLTYYYPNTQGGSVASHSKTATYGSTVDLKNIASTVTGNAPDGKVFIGWYEYNASSGTYGNLLTTQPNYGFVITKNQTIAAKYDTTAPTDDGVWNAYIDDNEITRQMNSSSTGKYYNDTIVRFRKGQDAAAHVPQGAEVGVLILNDGGTNGTITVSDTRKLDNYANNLTHGATGKIGTAGKTVTKLCKSITDANGNPLTYYNRYDFALRSDYSAAVNSKYTVYAYVKIGSTYTWSLVASGTYTPTV